MGIRDAFKKHSKTDSLEDPSTSQSDHRPKTPEFTFIRSDTTHEDILAPPEGHSGAGDVISSHSHGNFLSPPASPAAPGSASPPSSTTSRARRMSDVFRSRSRGSSISSRHESTSSTLGSPVSRPAPTRSLSSRLHLSRAPASSENVPQGLPEIVTPTQADGIDGAITGVGGQSVDKEGTESQWETRATLLARTVNENEELRLGIRSRSRTPSPARSPIDMGGDFGTLITTPPPDEKALAKPLPIDKATSKGAIIDEDIQEAIRLHETGDLINSTRMFSVLANPSGANDPLSQVLYGLALRHGWGCDPNPEKAVFFLTSAANNAASIESIALKAGMKKGGAAKGELVLAIFELANCFRHGWGIDKDPIAAKQYYETAANLGDTDAMNEVAWCYLEGFGCKKDKGAAAKYYRLAETNGNKTLGNTWIWKEKYDPGYKKK